MKGCHINGGRCFTIGDEKIAGKVHRLGSDWRSAEEEIHGQLAQPSPEGVDSVSGHANDGAKARHTPRPTCSIATSAQVADERTLDRAA